MRGLTPRPWTVVSTVWVFTTPVDRKFGTPVVALADHGVWADRLAVIAPAKSISLDTVIVIFFLFKVGLWSIVFLRRFYQRRKLGSGESWAVSRVSRRRS